MKPLTTQEKRVLDLVSQGLSSAKIAQMLCLSAHTVETHRKNLLIKMEAKNSADLVRRAFHFQVLGIDSAEVAGSVSLYKRVLLVVLLVCVVQLVMGQEKVITGKVTDVSDGMPIPGVSIHLKGTDRGTISDAEGNFSLSAPSSAKLLVFSSIGFKTVEVEIGGLNIINVSLTAEITQLSDVVVTGTGVSMEKRKLAIAVESVTSKDLPIVPTASIDQALVGKIPGALIMSGNGSPGSDISIMLRGVNSVNRGTMPMILMNGVQVASSSLNTLDLSTVDRIEVVQGAAAATIYGAQGANGVIQIFTKRGTKGRMEINFMSSVGRNEYINAGGLAAANFHGFATNSDNYVIAANGDTLAQDPKTLMYNHNVVWNPQDTSIQVNKPYNRNLQYHDHIKELYQSAITYNNSLTLSGGGDQLDYSVAISNTRQESNFINDGYNDRTNLILNTGVVITPKLTVRPITQLVYTRNTVHIYNKQDFSPRGLIAGLLTTRPFADLFVKDEEGNYGNYYGAAVGANMFNPLYSLRYTDTDDTRTDIIQSLQVAYTPLKYLKLDLNYGINHVSRTVRYQADNQSKIVNVVTTGRWSSVWNGAANTGEISTFEDTKTSQNLLTTATVNLDLHNDFGFRWPVRSTTQLALDYRSSTTHDYDTYGLGLPLLPPITANQATTFRIQTDFTTEFVTYGYLVNQRFEWGEIAGVSAGFRSDYSSAFGAGSKPFTFPRADAFVRLSGFNFFDKTFLSRMLLEWKIRAAYGQAGIQPNPYDRFPTLTSRTIGNTNSYYIGPLQSNPELDVEVSTEFEAGTDIVFQGLKGKWLRNVALNLTWWQRSTGNSIFAIDAPPSSGVGRFLDNAFTIDSDGFQGSLTVTGYKSNNFTWTLTANLGKQISIVGSVPGGEIVLGSYILKPGEKVGQLNGYLMIRDINAINPDTGAPFIAPSEQVNYEVASNGWVVNKLRKVPYITPGRYPLGDPFPDFNTSFINDLNFKGFITAGFQVDWVKGGKIYNQAKSWMYRDGVHADFTTPVSINGQSGAWAAFYDGVYAEVVRNGVKNYFYEDGSFARLRNAYIGFDFAPLIRTKLKRLQLVFSGRNLLTWTNYTGMDPEVSTYNNGGVLLQRWDDFVLPNQRTYQLTLNFGL